jgi:hypothetical protein
MIRVRDDDDDNIFSCAGDYGRESKVELSSNPNN